MQHEVGMAVRTFLKQGMGMAMLTRHLYIICTHACMKSVLMEQPCKICVIMNTRYIVCIGNIAYMEYSNGMLKS